MKKLLGLVFVSAIMLCGLAATSSAQTTYHRYHHRNINQRQENQQDRIARGINSGRLTPREASRLERQETRLNSKEAKYRASGGRLTSQERRKLQRGLNRENRRIYRQKHDRQGQRSM